MIDVALDFLCSQLESYIGTHTGFDAVHAKASSLTDPAGKFLLADDSVGLTVINVEEERAFKSQAPTHRFVNGQHIVLAPELRVNLMLLITPNFRQYDEALKCLSLILTFFQANGSFSVEQHPTLDPRIGKMSVEMQSMSFEQLNQLWAFLGTKYLPSVVYRVRMIVLQDFAPMAVGAPITRITTKLGGR